MIRYALIFIVTVLLFVLTGCDKYPGYEKVSDGVWKKLNSFSECKPDLNAAEYFLMRVSYKRHEGADTGYSFLLHHHALNAVSRTGYTGQPIGLRLKSVLDSMHCGDNISLILPFSEFNDTWLGAFADTTIYPTEEVMNLDLHLLKTFNKEEYARYLMQASQQQEISEAEAIELLLMNDVQMPFEKHGQCFLQYLTKASGDSILPGRETAILYNTFLLDGTRLDDTTRLEFTYGRPGQIIGGLQYALSLMQEGDEAMIYLPSALAFGEKGSTGNVVPPNTPIYFRLKVEQVD